MLDLLVLGNLIVDDVVYQDGATRMGQPGGAVLYVALAARLFGLRVGIASRVGDDYPRAMLEALEDRGIDVTGIDSMAGPGLRIWLLDEGDRRQVVHRLEGPSHGEACPRLGALPAGWQQAHAIHLAPMPWRLQSELVREIRQTSGDRLLSLDPFDLLRDRELERWRDLIARLDIFFLSQDEMLLSGDTEVILSDLAGDATLVFKQAAQGGVLWQAGSRSRWPGFASEVVDPTGAGDAFAAGFLAGRFAGDGTVGCIQRGAVAASFAIAGVGPSALLEASPEEVHERLTDLRLAWRAAKP